MREQPLHLLAGECALCQIMYSLAGLFWRRNNLGFALVIPSGKTASSYIILYDLLGRGGNQICLPPLMDRCGKIVSESNAKAGLLNEVFINQNTSLAPDACVFGPSPLNVTFDLRNIYPSDVQRVLRSLPNKASCGSDKISYRMMKEAGQGLVGPQAC